MNNCVDSGKRSDNLKNRTVFVLSKTEYNNSLGVCVSTKETLMQGLEQLRLGARRGLAAIEKKQVLTSQTNILPVTFTFNDVKKLPGMNQQRTESALAALRAKGMEFKRDESKQPSPYSFSLADVRSIYQEAGIQSNRQRLEQMGRWNGASVVAALSLKGGVGKSTTAATLASGFIHARNLIAQQMRICIIDLDPQASLSVAFGYKGLGLKEQHSAVEAIMTQASPDTLRQWVKPTASEGLYILPASSADSFFSLHAYRFADKTGINVTELLSKFVIEPLKNDFDLIIIDCGPHLDAALLNAMQCSHSMLIPVGLDPLEFDSTLKFVDRMYDLYDTIPSPILDPERIKFIATKQDASNQIHLDNYQIMMRCWPGHVLSHKMDNLRPFSAVFEEGQGQTVFTIQPKAYSGDSRSLKRALSVAENVVTEVFGALVNGETM